MEARNANTTLPQLLDAVVASQSSDLHLISNSLPHLRKDGQLYPIEGGQPLSAETVWSMVASIVTPPQRDQLAKDHDLDWSFNYRDVRFRANSYFAKGLPALSLRLIPSVVPTPDTLGIPSTLVQLAQANQGFIIVTGPTGHGKSTTIASILDYINQRAAHHVVTIEDPIEYVFTPRKSIISQREVGIDTDSFASGLKSALREDPNIAFVGEMRDLETTQTALTMAETGHLVMTTLHTNSAAQTPDRIVDAFAAAQQPQIRQQLANSLLGIVSQRLLPKISGGRLLVCEVLIATPAVRSLIRDGRTHQIPNVIQTSGADGMISLDQALASYVNQGVVTADDAMAWSTDAKNLQLLLYK